MSSFKSIFRVVGSEPTEQPGMMGAESVNERITRDIAENGILIYMKGTPEFPQCGFSASTVEIFEELGVPYSTRDVLEDPELRQAIKAYSKWPTIPQVYIAGRFVGGCDIITEMHQRSELAPLVHEALED